MTASKPVASTSRSQGCSPAVGTHPRGGDRLDGCRPQVDELDVVLVERVVVPLLERRALHPEGVGRLGRSEDLGHGGIVHALVDLGTPEVVGRPVRGLVQEQVRVAAGPEGETALLPQPLVGLQPFLVRHVERVDAALGVGEAAVGLGALLEDRRVLRLGLVLVVTGEATLLHRQRQDGRALEHGDVLGDPGRLLDDLHAAGAGADHGHPPTAEVHALLGPVGGVGPLAAEVGEPRDVGDVGLGGEPGAQHHEPGAQRLVAVGAHVPAPLLLVPGRARDPGAEPDVVAQPPDGVDVVEVAPQRLPVGEALVPVPVLPEGGVGVLIERHVRIDPCPGVAVPVPDAAEPGAGLDQGDPQAEPAQVVQLVETGESGADDDDVVLGSAHRRRASAHERPCSTSTSWGSPSTRSPMMLRCTTPVPPPTVRAGANRNPCAHIAGSPP